MQHNHNIKLNDEKTKRIFEIDLFKGIAVILMIIFHIPYLYTMMGYGYQPIQDGILLYMARISEFIFITNVGVNLTLSRRKNTKEQFIKKQFLRVFKIVLLALFFTVSTYILFPAIYVKFGILHFIATAILLLMWISKSIIYNCLIILCVLYARFNKILIKNTLNLPRVLNFVFGLFPEYSSMDHFPLVPWLGIAAFGVIVGNILYKENNKKIERRIKKMDDLEQFSNSSVSKYLQYLGKYSFPIYAIHFVILYILIKIIMNTVHKICPPEL
tara:strand:+ start:3661 stop:4476 length:816 start_codon:yes stop_codon:yes gene_type:complete